MGNEQPRRSGLRTFAIIWTALVAIIPVVFGVMMLVNPAAVSVPSVTTAALFRAMAFRNFAFSAVLAWSLVTQPKRVVAFLLFARGLTEIADGLSGVFATSPGAMTGPFIGGIGDIAIAWYFMRLKDEPATGVASG